MTLIKNEYKNPTQNEVEHDTKRAITYRTIFIADEDLRSKFKGRVDTDQKINGESTFHIDELRNVYIETKESYQRVGSLPLALKNRDDDISILITYLNQKIGKEILVDEDGMAPVPMRNKDKDKARSNLEGKILVYDTTEEYN